MQIQAGSIIPKIPGKTPDDSYKGSVEGLKLGAAGGALTALFIGGAMPWEAGGGSGGFGKFVLGGAVAGAIAGAAGGALLDDIL